MAVVKHIVRLIVFLLNFAVIACGINLYDSMSSKETDRYNLEEAKILIDEKKYDEAEIHLNKVKNNTNEKVLLEVGVKLGKVGLSIWDLLVQVVEDTSELSNSDETGVEQIFNLFSDNIFGTGAERTEKLEALVGSINLLKSAPEQNQKIESYSCFLTGIHVLPIANDGASAMLTVTRSLENLENTITGDGTNSDECPGLDSFENAVNTLAIVKDNLDLIINETANCSILSFLSNNNDSLNAMSERLKKFVDGADQGCPTVNCGSDLACSALQLGCVGSVLDTNSAVSGDNIVSQCEMIYNCRVPGTCF